MVLTSAWFWPAPWPSDSKVNMQCGQWRPASFLSDTVINFPKLCFSVMQQLFPRTEKKKKKNVTSLLNTMQRSISSSSVLKRYGKSFVPWSWCCSTTYRRTTPQACNGDVCCSYKDSLASQYHLQRSFNTSQNSARAPLYSKDSILLLKPIESSTVHLLRLYEREMICPRVDCTVLILSCWEGWCAQLTLLWKVEVILGSLHFANPGE